MNRADLTLIEEPRCKICRSEHRPAIDAMLLDGRSQAQVVRHWNAQRHTDWLTPSGVSRHANRHLDRRHQDLSIFDSLPFLEHGRSKLRQREVLDAIIDGGAAALYAGIVVVEPSDMFAALKQRDTDELREMRETLKWMLGRFALFLEAFSMVLPESIQDEVFDEYRRLVDDTPEAG